MFVKEIDRVIEITFRFLVAVLGLVWFVIVLFKFNLTF